MAHLSQGSFPGTAVRVPAGMPVDHLLSSDYGAGTVLPLPRRARGVLCGWGRCRAVMSGGCICIP